MSVKFNSFGASKPSVYLCLNEENLNNFYGLVTVLKHVAKKRTTHKIGVAFKSSLLQKLGSNVPWLDLPTISVDKVPSSIPLALVNPSPEKVAHWETSDRETDFNLQKMKYPHIDEERLRVDDFFYSEPLSVMRDVLDIFDVYPGERPVDIFNLGKNICYLDNKQLSQAGFNILRKNNIKSGPFGLVEVGFGDWDGSSITPDSWGRVIRLPNYSDFLQLSDEEALGYLNLISHRDCAAVGITSFGYIMPSVSAYNKNKNVIWDLRSNYKNEEFQNKNQLLGHHLPLSIKVIAPMVDDGSDRIRLELVYSFGDYFNQNKKLISQNKGMEALSRPIVDPSFTYSWA